MKQNLTLLNWRVSKRIDAYMLLGDVYGHPSFKDGTFVRTSPIQEIIEEEDIFRVNTYSGSHYILNKNDCVSVGEIELLRVISK